MTMSRQAAAGRRSGAQLVGMATPGVCSQGDEFIPTAVLKQLAEDAFTAEQRTYTARLNELLNRS